MEEFLQSKYPYLDMVSLYLQENQYLILEIDNLYIYNKTDSSTTEIFQIKYVKFSISFFFTKFKNQKFIVENVNLEHLLKVNQIFNDSFAGKAFSDKKLDLYLKML